MKKYVNNVFSLFVSLVGPNICKYFVYLNIFTEPAPTPIQSIRRKVSLSVCLDVCPPPPFLGTF